MADKLTLPNGIKIEDKVYKIAYLKEMTGRQQDYLINTKYKSPIEHIEPIFSDLIDKIETEDGEELKEKKQHIVRSLLPLDDIIYLIAKLREITFDDKMIIDAECSHCSNKQSLQFNISSLEIIEPETPKNRVITLPKSGLEVTYRPLYYEALKQYSSNRDRMLNSATTSTIAMLVEKLGDKDNPNEEDIKNLTAKDINYIRDNAPEYNKLDTTITSTCNKCEKDFDHELEVLSSDFLAQ